MNDLSYSKVDSVYSLYSTAVTVSGTDDKLNAVDKDGNEISINMDDVNANYISKNYKNERLVKYASISDQLDMLYKDIVDGKLDTTGTWATHIKAVKDANPKP